MPIPPFGSNGLLPAFNIADPINTNQSPYDASIVELVQQFATTDERRRLLGNLIAYRQLLAHDDYVTGFQFIDGSFVEQVELIRKKPPGDIDVVSFLQLPTKYENNSAAWAATGWPFWRDEIAAHQRNKARFTLDTYALMQSSAGYRMYTYWHGLFSRQRDTFAWKGYLVIPLDAQADVKALADLGAM